jgi:hypothetical protein
MSITEPSIIIFTIAVLLTGCMAQGRTPTQVATSLINRESITTTTHDIYPVKNPQTVALYTNEKPHAAYRVIGIAKVSKYNMFGIERQNNTLHSMMKNLAASIGGDGLIELNHTNDNVQAKVIAYQKILI